MAEIVLTTLNAKYIHAAFGLRYLLANLGPLRARAALLEFDLNQRPLEIAEKLLLTQPRIIALGVYVWNAGPSLELVSLLKRLRPEILLVLGGPEVSHETEEQAITGLADYVITGEADLDFRNLCERLLGQEKPQGKVINAAPPALEDVVLPYDLYSEQDLAHRVIYVEASRGCPFSCEFCLSALEIPVRQLPLPAFFGEMEKLLARGAREFKFVDRTFNLDVKASRAVLDFCLEHYEPGRFFHFEMIPDRLPVELREPLAKFPPGALQLEIGVQSFNPAVCERISRRQNVSRVEQNFRFLREKTRAHVHADLIAGLPGESLESFAAGFDRLVALGPQEIQVGILKRLRGAPIARHTKEWGMIYNPQAPYEILENKLINFATMQRLRRFARYWDLTANSGNFLESTPLLWGKGSAFAGFLRWSDWLYARTGRTDSIALGRLFSLLYEYLVDVLKLDRVDAGKVLARDYQRSGRSDVPGWLEEFGGRRDEPKAVKKLGPKRQSRHLPERT